jgi:hypothetical protein
VFAQEINGGSLNSRQAPKRTFNEVQSTSWRIKSSPSGGCSADPYTVSIVFASDRSRMSSSSGHGLKKSAGTVNSSIHICNGGSILNCQSAAAFGSNGALANYRLRHPLFHSYLFSHLNVVTMLFLSARCNSYCCSRAAVCLQWSFRKAVAG